MEDAATQITEDEMAVARMLDGSVGIMTLAAMTGIGTGASALRKTIAVTQTIGTTTGVADVIGTGGAIIIILTVTGIGEVVHAKDIRFWDIILEKVTRWAFLRAISPGRLSTMDVSK